MDNSYDATSDVYSNSNRCRYNTYDQNNNELLSSNSQYNTKSCYVIDNDNYYHYCTPVFTSVVNETLVNVSQVTYSQRLYNAFESFFSYVENRNMNEITIDDWNYYNYTTTQLCELNVIYFSIYYINIMIYKYYIYEIVL